MNGETDLTTLLASMRPSLIDENYTFCTIPSGKYGDLAQAKPIASFQEKEGLSLVIKQTEAESLGLHYNGTFKCISLEVHSSLEAVGLTAAIATALKNANISANVIAGYYHDHIFVPSELADKALHILRTINSQTETQAGE